MQLMCAILVTYNSINHNFSYYAVEAVKTDTKAENNFQYIFHTMKNVPENSILPGFCVSDVYIVSHMFGFVNL